MMTRQNQCILDNLDEIVELYRTLFFNERDHIAMQILDKKKKTPHWRYTPEKLKDRTTDLSHLLTHHLRGKKTYAFYSHSENGTCKWVCFDVDIKEGLFEDRFLKAQGILKMVRDQVLAMGIPPEALLVDFSGSKGYHLWVMIEETPMAKAQNFIKHVEEKLGTLPYDTRLDRFPHPSTNPEESPFGLPVKLPCALHNAVKEYSYYVDGDYCGIIDVLAHLRKVKPCNLPDLPLLINHKEAKTARRPQGSRAKSKVQNASVSGPIPQPLMTEDLSLLFKECKFLRNYKASPASSGYWEWTWAGLLLCSLGWHGEQWFSHLSSLDQCRYHGTHQDIINKIRDGDLKPPTCRTIGCSLCGRTSPLECLGKTRKRYRLYYDAETQDAEQYELNDLREEYRQQIRSLLASGENGVYLSNFPLGSGKTTMTLEEVLGSGRRLLYYCPTHKLAEEVRPKCDGKGKPVLGLDHLQKTISFHCPHQQDIARNIQHGFSSEEYCSKNDGLCELRRTCPYLQQFEEARNADIVLLVHDHLKLGETKRAMLFQDRQLAIIDESFVKQYRSEVVIDRSQILALEAATKAIKLHAPVRQTIVSLKAILDSSIQVMVLPEFSLYPRHFKEIDQAFRDLYPDHRNPLRYLYRAANEGLTIHRKSEDTLAINMPVQLPEGMPILILDATATAEDYERLLNCPIKTINPAQGKRLKMYARTFQVVTGGYTNKSLLDEDGLTVLGTHIVEFVKDHIRDDQDYGIICTMKMEEQLVKEGLIPPEGMMHFNNLRGLNEFAKVRDLFIIGYQGISYREIVRQSRILFDQGWNDEVMESLLSKEKSFSPLKMYGNRQCQVHTLQPSDPYVLTYHNFCIRGEVEQAIGRARIYSDCGKTDRHVYLITNHPTTLEIEEIIEFEHRKEDKMLEAARKLLLLHGEFSREDLEKLSGFSDRYVRDKIDGIVVELGLIEETRASNKKVYWTATHAKKEKIAA